MEEEGKEEMTATEGLDKKNHQYANDWHSDAKLPKMCYVP